MAIDLGAFFATPFQVGQVRQGLYTATRANLVKRKRANTHQGVNNHYGPAHEYFFLAEQELL
jgi:hypothetical protein